MFLLKKSIEILLKCSKINKYIINIKKKKKLLHWLIYILGFLELKTLKTYIKTNLRNGFIRP